MQGAVGGRGGEEMEEEAFSIFHFSFFIWSFSDLISWASCDFMDRVACPTYQNDPRKYTKHHEMRSGMTK